MQKSVEKFNNSLYSELDNHPNSIWLQNDDIFCIIKSNYKKPTKLYVINYDYIRQCLSDTRAALRWVLRGF